jgi:glycosyltransferase involved in cell wall biosynthesis
MIKIMHVLSDMKIGGAGSWLLNLLGAIDKEKFEIKVVLPQGSMLADKIKNLGFEVISVDGIKDKSYDARAVNLLYYIFRAEKPDIVHTHASLSARLAAKRAGARIINTKHCIDGRITGIRRFTGTLINDRYCDSIIAVSEAVKRNIAENGVPEDKISVIYGGINPVKILDDKEKSLVREKWGIEEEVVVGIVARLAEVKGHKYFIDAAEIISRDNDNVRFFIAGTGPKEEELKELIKQKGLTDKVVFTGFVDEIYEVFNIIDINVISSLSEALCLSLIEGMSAGKPSVAADTGGIPEVVKDGYNGFLVPPGDAKGLADAILKLIRDPGLRKTMGDRGREIMEKSFTAEIMAENIEGLYESVARKNRRE